MCSICRRKADVETYNNRRKDEAFANEVLDDVYKEVLEQAENFKKYAR